LRYAGVMRDLDDGGLTAAEQARRERVRLGAQLIEAGAGVPVQVDGAQLRERKSTKLNVTIAQ